MMLHRLLALLTSVTMLHLSVVTGDVACASHGMASDHAARATHAMPAHDHAMRAVVRGAHEGAVSDAPPCETPVQLHCCEALMGCDVTGVAAVARELYATRFVPGARILTSLHDAPASFASPPEPPPPKA